MASLKALKVRIGSVKSTQKITKAMKMVAAAKLRRAQEAAEAGASLCRAAGSGDGEPRRRRSTVSESRAEAARRHRQGPGPSAGRRDLATGPRRCVQHQHRPRRAPQGAQELIERGQDRQVLPHRQQGPRAASRGSIREQIVADHRDRAIIGKLDLRPMRAAIAEDVDRAASRPASSTSRICSIRKFQSALVQEPTDQQIIPVAVADRRRRRHARRRRGRI